MTQYAEPPLAADLLHGVRAIAEYIGIPERDAHWQIRQGNLPVTRMGRLVVSSKAVLREHLTPKPVAAREKETA